MKLPASALIRPTTESNLVLATSLCERGTKTRRPHANSFCLRHTQTVIVGARSAPKDNTPTRRPLLPLTGLTMQTIYEASSDTFGAGSATTAAKSNVIGGEGWRSWLGDGTRVSPRAAYEEFPTPLGPRWIAMLGNQGIQKIQESFV
jgi:hypothetical protein